MHAELDDKLNTYKKDGLLNAKYYDLLNSVGKFINKYDIDVSIIKKSTVDLINSYYRLTVLNKVCFTEPEGEINDEINGEINDEINDETDEINDEINGNSTNNKLFISDEEHENDLRIILRNAIKINDRELIICTMNLLKKIDEDKTNTATTASVTSIAPATYNKTPKWLLPLKCTINPENNKKLADKSFKYAIAASKTSGHKRFRLTKIKKHINEFNFENINYPLSENDYETFENNNESIKLIILKQMDEKELIFSYNDTNKNDRETKLFLLLLNNHYIFITKPKLLLKYVKYID